MPLALTSKSSNGRVLARSCDGWAAQWMIRSGAVSAKTRSMAARSRMSSEWCSKLRAGPSQSREGPVGVAARAEEVGPHIVVDAEDLCLPTVEVDDGLRSDQSTAAGD